jgi:hypothetical protein
MNLSKVIEQLRAELAAMDRAILAMESLADARTKGAAQTLELRRRGRPPGSRNRVKRVTKRTLTEQYGGSR